MKEFTLTLQTTWQISGWHLLKSLKQACLISVKMNRLQEIYCIKKLRRIIGGIKVKDNLLGGFNETQFLAIQKFGEVKL